MILIIGVVVGMVLTGMAALDGGYWNFGDFMAVWTVAAVILVSVGSLIWWAWGILGQDTVTASTASSRSGMGGDVVVEEIVEETRVEETEAPRETATRQFDFGFREIEAGNFGGEK